jgi:hypothetical protein
MKYKKKPIVIDAFRLGVDEMENWAWELRNTTITFIFSGDTKTKPQALISTLEGNMTANYGDYIIKGVAGEVYPCKPDIFKATYELAENSTDEHQYFYKGNKTSR